MRTRNPSLATSLITLVFLFSATGAHALSVDSSNSGLDQAQGCADAGCFTTLYDTISSSGAVTGDLDITGGVLDFTIQLASATLAAVAGGDGGVTSLDFSGMTYSGSVAVTLDGSNNYTIDGGQAAAISGTVTPIGAGTPSAIAATNVLVTGLCSGTPGSDLQCGLIFAPIADFSADVNGNTRYFTNSVDVFTIVPEPGTALLFGLGLIGLNGMNRRR